MTNWLRLLALITVFGACKKNDIKVYPDLVFQLKFDNSQERLDNFGAPSKMPEGHAAQSPTMREMSLNYIELAPDSLTQLGKGTIVYQGVETTNGGAKAIEFDKAKRAASDQEFARISVKDLAPGVYTWIRASVSYQNYNIKFNLNDVPGIGNLSQQTGTVASFVGYNTYIKKVVPRTMSLTVGGNKAQGFWVFESALDVPYSGYNRVFFGQAPVGSTTVVNPLFNSSPVPAGSCVVTGKLDEPLVITGEETADQTVILSFSINESLEWVDDNGNKQLDFYGAPGTPNEKIVDMGIRGLKGKLNR